MTQQEPVLTFRAGSVTCALWENQIAVGERNVSVLKASIDRRYKDDRGEWRSSQSLSRNEIPLAIYVLEKAFEAMIERPKESTDESADGRGGPHGPSAPSSWQKAWPQASASGR